MILIVDFGSQYTHLILRRLRGLGVSAQIASPDRAGPLLRAPTLAGIILSGGPRSVLDADAPRCPEGVWDAGVPILGICYGMQLMCHELGGEVAPASRREYGLAEMTLLEDSELLPLSHTEAHLRIWMSHGDECRRLPPGCRPLGATDNAPIAALRGQVDRGGRVLQLYGLQFHPEVKHTERGEEILANFVRRICRVSDEGPGEDFIDATLASIRGQAPAGRVLCALSGGVDSAVTALLLHRAIGDRAVFVFVDNGLLRRQDRPFIEDVFIGQLGIDVHILDERQRFLRALEGVSDPEVKRRRIGHAFVDAFEQFAAQLDDVRFLAQGTLYPDRIESQATSGPAATIKTHHNVGGLPERMKLTLIEPLRDLFKDEVRLVGRSLGMPDVAVERQPFPGPGLAVRIIGPVTEEDLDVVRQADAIVTEEIETLPNRRDVWQYFAVLLPLQTVGVMGDERTYEKVIALRAVESTDGMTADWFPLPHELLGRISRRIVNEVKGVNRVVYDISSKPPATIEWE